MDLAYIECSPSSDSSLPTVLLIHGLDSSSHTWRSIQPLLPSRSVALDCRGCGRSPMGDVDDFTTENVVDDVKRLVESHRFLHGSDKKPFVLLGHSMGGRIAMSYAAKYPADVAALVIEDMDIRRRPVSSNFIPLVEHLALNFHREFESENAALKSFAEVGYPEYMVLRWIKEGRIYRKEPDQQESKLWSDVNPAFRLLCYRQFFDSDCGEKSWNALAANGKNPEQFPITLMVAGVGTVCDESSVDDMVELMGDKLTVNRYPQGKHSIHNTARESFMKDLVEIIENAAAKE
uniref:AB hydrolase-1 domain-containing protein n=1 Tax=Pseudictyota dubia TaxID=2749911 RepID=A0A7R9Z0U3_9STRA